MIYEGRRNYLTQINIERCEVLLVFDKFLLCVDIQ